MRSKQSLGYVVHEGSYQLGNRNGILFVIQGNVDPHYMHFRVLEFIYDKIPAILEEYKNDAEKFEDFKLTLADTIDTTIDTQEKLDESTWGEITTSRYDFDRKMKVGDFMKSQNMTFQMVEEFYQNWIYNSTRMTTVEVAGLSKNPDYGRDNLLAEVLGARVGWG